MARSVFFAGVVTCMVWGYAAAEPVSTARWLWAQPENAASGVPSNAYLRLDFEVTGTVTNAWFFRWADKRCADYVNGKRVEPRLWEPHRKYFGHVKGNGLDIRSHLKPGRNVLAFELGKNVRGCYGLMLRGEIAFADGRVLKLFSNPKQVKGAGRATAGWNEAAFDDASWKPAVSRGDVLMAPWALYGNTPAIFMAPEEYARYDAACREGLQAEALLREPDSPNARIVYSGDTPGIEINGKAYPPYRLGTVTPVRSASQDKMLRHARAIGMNIFEIGVDFRYATGNGSFDFTTFGNAICDILSVWPEAYAIFHFHIHDHGSRWLKSHPEEAVGYAIERKGRRDLGDYHANPPVASFASPAFRGEVRRFVLALGDYCLKQPWGRRVLGMLEGYGGSGDGMPFGCHSWPDTGLRMTEAFRRFLTEKYATDAALRKAWGDPSVTLGTAAVPDASVREGSGLVVRDLSQGADRRRADFLEAYHREFNDYAAAFCRAVKDAFPGRLAGFFYGYTVLSYESEGSTARFEELLARPEVDFLKATTRGYNLTDGLHRHIPSVFHRLGKLSSIEGDVRTHVGLLSGQAETQWCCRTPEETRSTVAKFVCNALVSGVGWHSVDFGVENLKWFDCPEALEPMRTGLEEWKVCWAHPMAAAGESSAAAGADADTLVVFDPAQVWREGHASYERTQAYQDNLVTFALQTLNFSGYACDLAAVDDVPAALEKKSYRAVVFLNTAGDTPALRRAAARARRPGRTVAWCATPGLSTPKGFSSEAMAQLTGMKLDYACAPSVLAAKGVGTSPGKWGTYGAFAVRRDFRDAPRVFVREGDAEALGKWTDDGTVAFARKTLADGSRAVFLGMPFNRAADWAQLLGEAGAHAYTKPGFYVRRNARYLMVFSGKGALVPPESIVLKDQLAQDGRVRVTLGKPAGKLRDVLTGEIVARDTDAFELNAARPRVWLLRED